MPWQDNEAFLLTDEKSKKTQDFSQIILTPSSPLEV